MRRGYVARPIREALGHYDATRRRSKPPSSPNLAFLNRRIDPLHIRMISGECMITEKYTR